MNIFNRVVILILALATLAASVGVLLMLIAGVQPAAISPTPWIAAQLDTLRTLNTMERNRALVAAIAAFIVALVLIIMEVWPRRAPTYFAIKQDELGRVAVARAAIRDLISHEATRSPEVLDVRPTLITNGRGIRIHCLVSVLRTANVPSLSAELRQRVKASVEHHLGVPVREVSVASQIAPIDRRRRRVR